MGLGSSHLMFRGGGIHHNDGVKGIYIGYYKSNGEAPTNYPGQAQIMAATARYTHPDRPSHARSVKRPHDTP